MGEVKVQSHNVSLTMTLHNHRFRQVHESLNRWYPVKRAQPAMLTDGRYGPFGRIPSKLGNSIPRFQRYAVRKVWTQFVANLTSFGPWASPYGANGQMTMTVHNFRPRQFHRTSNRDNPSSGYRDMGSENLAATPLPRL